MPKKISLKTAQHTIPQDLLNSITKTFNISHSYFSSSVTCSTHITKFYSPFARDKVFGSLDTAFQYKCNGIGYAHPHNEETTQQAIHWARLAAKNDPNTIILLVTPDINWYQNYSPHIGPFPDTHVIAHFSADTITYEEPINPQNINKQWIEPSAIHIFCIHHQDHIIGTPNQIDTIKTTTENLQIPQYHIQKAPPTPRNTFVNKNAKWNKILYPPHTHPPNYETDTTLKFPPQYNYYTDGSFVPPIQSNDRH
jgi:ribonuclease HI